MRKLVLPGVFLALLACSVPAMAQTPYPGYGAQVQPLERVLPAIRAGRPGRFYDAEGPFSTPDGSLHYRIKWLTPEGRIVWLDADARTGRVNGAFRGYTPGAPPSGLRFWGRPRFGPHPFGPRGWGRPGLGRGPRFGR